MAKNNGIIRRRIGGVSQQTGKGTDISKLKRKSKKYEDISSTYEAARKDKPKRKIIKKTTTTTPTKKSTRSNLEKLRARATETGPSTRLYSAVAEGSKRAERARERKRETKETPF